MARVICRILFLQVVRFAVGKAQPCTAESRICLRGKERFFSQTELPLTPAPAPRLPRDWIPAGTERRENSNGADRTTAAASRARSSRRALPTGRGAQPRVTQPCRPAANGHTRLPKLLSLGVPTMFFLQAPGSMVFSFQLPPPLLPLGVPLNPRLDSEQDTAFPGFFPPTLIPLADWPSSHFMAANAHWETDKVVIKLQMRKQIGDFISSSKKLHF